ncbi:unnamed protein product [Rotaria sp. Silwood1]|nr:unnamed protein product [Rotaria sp. Silwood1]CAF0955556.1 unnamed protein product [Rotaria sp. Silwood1]CAF3478542.1 unnamed protein product [Rotaria sp. Silwood1]CAF4993855.1 unnamed protein product [Rotaria sp. Silwood1]
MSSDNEQISSMRGGIKRQHSVEDFESIKEAKTDKTLEENLDTKQKELTNNHHEIKNDDEFLEKGDIVFMYKPKLNVDEALSFDDVQLFHVLLIPEEDETNLKDSSSKIRLIKIGKKKLPTIGKERYWAFVEKADNDIEKLEEKLEVQTYETATVGTRTIKADRIAGKGKYVMAKHDQRRTVIGYVLESPSDIGAVQSVFNITKEASFSVAVKNPKKRSPPAAGLSHSQKAEYSEEIQKKFGSYQWLPAEPAMLDVPGCEMVWIGSSTDDLEELLGELGREIEEEADSNLTATEVMKDIQLDEAQHPIQPLVDGKWPKQEDAPEKKDHEEEYKTENENKNIEDKKTEE